MAAPVYTKDGLAEYIKRGVATIGDHSYGVPALRYPVFGQNLTIGRFCSISDRVEIFLGGDHRPDWVSTYPFPAFNGWPESAGVKDYAVSRGGVVIGHDVWIGSQVTIMAGVTIGHGAVIGSKAVVAKDVSPYAIVAGNPARVIKLRFDEDTIAALLRIAWWDWPQDQIRGSVRELMAGDIAGFIAKHDPGA